MLARGLEVQGDPWVVWNQSKQVTVSKTTKISDKVLKQPYLGMDNICYINMEETSFYITNV